MVKAITEFK